MWLCGEPGTTTHDPDGQASVSASTHSRYAGLPLITGSASTHGTSYGWALRTRSMILSTRDVLVCNDTRSSHSSWMPFCQR